MTDEKTRSWREEFIRVARGEKPTPLEEMPPVEPISKLISEAQPMTGPVPDDYQLVMGSLVRDPPDPRCRIKKES